MDFWDVPFNDVDYYYGLFCDPHFLVPPRRTPDGIHFVHNPKTGKVACIKVVNGKSVERIGFYEPEHGAYFSHPIAD